MPIYIFNLCRCANFAGDAWRLSVLRFKEEIDKMDELSIDELKNLRNKIEEYCSIWRYAADGSHGLSLDCEGYHLVSNEIEKRGGQMRTENDEQSPGWVIVIILIIVIICIW